MTALINLSALRHSFVARMVWIVLGGMIVTAGVGLWASIPIVRSLAEMASDNKQNEMLGETRLHLVDLYKMRRRFVEGNILRCLSSHKDLGSCDLDITGEPLFLNRMPSAEAVGIDIADSAARISWPSESLVHVYDGKNYWQASLPIKPVRPLADEISGWLTAHEHLNLVIDNLKNSLIMTLVITAFGGVFVCLLLMSIFSRRMRSQYRALRDYIQTLSRRGTQPVPEVLESKSELSVLAKEVYGMSFELAMAQERMVEAERMSVWQTMARKVAHEIKNPLTPIGLVGEQLALVAQRIQDASLKSTLCESSRIIVEETASLNRMVREFTAFARLPKPQMQRIDLNGLIKDFVDRNQMVDGPVLAMKSESNVAWIDADPAMLHQIFHNLVNNARLAKSPERVHILFEWKVLDHFWLIDVIDDGPGVPETLRAKMFDAYVTSRSTGEKEKGMGLGLTISRQIASDHGGTLQLHHSDANGTTMRLKLPNAEEAKGVGL